MDKSSAIEIVRRYANLVRKSLPVKQVILYGSYARGDQRAYSDIDVAVIVRKLEGDILELSAMLNRLTRDIDSTIDPLLLEDGYDPSGFLDHIKATGIVVYSSEQDAIPAK